MQTFFCDIKGVGRKKFLHIIGIYLFNFVASAQNEASIYYFGTAGIDFRTDPPSILLNSAMNAPEGSAVICDKQGKLLFYTNGGSHPMQPDKNGAIWNNKHQIMHNGELFDTAGCNSSSQGVVIIPVPERYKQYYVFTKDCIETNYFGDKYDNRGMRYTIVDLSFNNGLGSVIKKGIPLIPYGNSKSADENVAAMQHQNKIAYWIFSYFEGKIVSFLVDTIGINPYQIHDFGNGQIIASPKGDYILFGKKLYQFNDLSGEIQYLLTMPVNTLSLEFSPDGQYLYTTEKGTNYVYPIYQYKLNGEAVNLNKKFIARGGGMILSLAPDGKIYNHNGKQGNRLEGAINCPNEEGLNCAFFQRPIYLGGRTGSEFPNVIKNYLYKTDMVCMEEPTPYTPEVEIPSPECPFLVYPNPSNESLTLAMYNDTIGMYRFSVYDLSGRLIENHVSVPRSGYTFETKSYAQGSYILQMIISDERVCKHKIMVVH